MKKTTMLLLIALIFLSITGCENKHEHSWTEWEYQPELDSNNQLQQQRNCIECGWVEQRTIETEQIKLTKENFDDYFEFSYHVNWGYDPFGDVDVNNTWLYCGWDLKEEYVRRFATVSDSPLARIRSLIVPLYEVEFNKESINGYTIKERKDAEILSELLLYERTEDVSLAYRDIWNSAQNKDNTVYGFFCNIAGPTLNNTRLYQIHSTEDMILEKVKGTIILIKE